MSSDTATLEPTEPATSGRGMLIGLTCAALGIAMAWSLAPALLVAPPAIGLAVIALWLGICKPPANPGAWLAALAAAAAIVSASRPVAWWSCGIDCGGAAAYGELFGVSVTWLASAAYATVAIAAGLAATRSARLPVMLQVAAWGAVGISIWYLILSARLGLVCDHCLATHGVVLCWSVALVRGSLPWLGRAAGGLVAALALHALFHPGPIEPAPLLPADQPGAGDRLSSTDVQMITAADRGRQRGRSDAATVLELAIDPTCPHCATATPLLLARLEPALASGTIRLVIRHRRGPGVDESLLLARLGLASAVAGDWFSAYLPLMVGIDGTSDAEAVWAHAVAHHPSRGAALWQRLVDRHSQAFDQLQAADEDRLRQLGMASGPTPHAALVSGGRVSTRWVGEAVTPQAIGHVVDALAQP